MLALNVVLSRKRIPTYEKHLLGDGGVVLLWKQMGQKG